ncbi:Uncharacterised protein [Serratia fonticola]|uniref:Uncharacterized protein n=1 Tax=Serratia fonticola TaxID=47917 RepID=A0A4U9USE3_SERFO|nr:Uncharacterised protein [Serratia fonticola]
MSEIASAACLMKKTAAYIYATPHEMICEAFPMQAVRCGAIAMIITVGWRLAIVPTTALSSSPTIAMAT